MGSKELSDVAGGALVKPTVASANEAVTQMNGPKSAIRDRGTGCVQLVVTTPLSEEERIGWGTELLQYSGSITSTIHWSSSPLDGYRITPRPKGAEEEFREKVWKWAFPTAKFVREIAESKVK